MPKTPLMNAVLRIFPTLLLLTFPSAAIAGTIRRGIEPTPWGSIAYRLFLPEEVDSRPSEEMPVLVVLHGCKQDAEAIARVSRFDEHAERGGFAVLYPEQSPLANPDRCWNWFLPENQARLGAEPARIAHLAGAIRARLGAGKVFAAGLSSGAGMVAILGACHPDLFKGIALHSGVQFAAASDPGSAISTLETGSLVPPSVAGTLAHRCAPDHVIPLWKAPRAFVLHGTEDRRVVPRNAAQLAAQLAQHHDWRDDGMDNDSVSEHEPSCRQVVPPRGHRYRIEDIGREGVTFVRYVEVEGLAHAWSGGPVEERFSDPDGPDASALIWNYLSSP